MLKISRPDISAESFQEFNLSERFFKLPVPKYLDLLGIEANRPQTAFFNALNNPKYRFVVACFARRLGKTYAANIAAQLISLVPGCNILLIAPDYSLSTISWDLQKSLIRKFDLETEKDNQKERIITLSNESSIRMASVSRADSAVGRSYDFILFDEAALCANGEEVFNVQLRPTLDKPNSKAVFISTPRGMHNYFKKFVDRGYSEDTPTWVSLHADWHENPRASEEDILSARNEMTYAEFRQEYYGEFQVFEGKIWNFDSEKCVQEFDYTELEMADFIMGVDVGFRDPTAACVIAYDYKTEKYYVVDEYFSREKTTSIHAENIKRLEEKYSVDSIFVDSANVQTRFDWAHDFDLATIGAKKGNDSILASIASVNVILESDRLIVHPRCKHTILALDQYQWEEDKKTKKEAPKDNLASHMSDALRYAIYTYIP